MKAELKRDGFKNSYKNELDETVAKKLRISDTTIYNWKRELGQTIPKHKYSHSEQKELMKRYYKIKGKNPKMSVGDIAKMLKIGRATLVRWKKQFHPNSVDGHFTVNVTGKCLLPNTTENNNIMFL
uniref:Transposase n=1 Tax=Globodera rostochiensis TaxID=31243 RepID=A0A914IFL1_GLORO